LGFLPARGAKAGQSAPALGQNLTDLDKNRGEFIDETKMYFDELQLEGRVFGAIFIQFSMERAPVNAEDFSGS